MKRALRTASTIRGSTWKSSAREILYESNKATYTSGVWDNGCPDNSSRDRNPYDLDHHCVRP